MTKWDTDAIEAALLKSVNLGEVNSRQFCAEHGIEHATLERVITSLRNEQIIVTDRCDTTSLVLTADGEEALQEGSPEARVVRLLQDEPMKKGDLMKKLPVAKKGFSEAMKRRWVRVNKETGMLEAAVDSVDDQLHLALRAFAEGTMTKDQEKLVTDKKRKMSKTKKVLTFAVNKGEAFVVQRRKQVANVTSDMFKTGEWRDIDFKPYNFAARGKLALPGALHPLCQVRSEFKRILVSMGFEEMPTNNYVESGFWNFDSLFQPQQHPARDAHDTFFLSTPAVAKDLASDDYVERVCKTHSEGGYGSIGWRYDWSLEEASKNILRTHTTAVSARMLHKLAQQEHFEPKRYFSIDRVFRNETVDATHLAEFHQVEGLVADYDLTLGDLIGTVQAFFTAIGIPDVRFKPAYNPYTEPSMEIFGYSEQLGKYIELGNSGIFRPEMLRPMGLPEGVRVIAWGFGLERQTMLKFGIRSIRSLFGHAVDINMVQTNPLPRFGY
ncbi:MAG: hypothetical protein MHM6MM_006394 [Cercozoa sp. M6MM]